MKMRFVFYSVQIRGTIDRIFTVSCTFVILIDTFMRLLSFF